MMLDLIQVFLVVSTLVIFLIYRKKMYTGPPYVTGLPLLGYMPFLGKETYLSFQHLMEKHGPIFRILKTQFWDLWDEEIERQKKTFSQNNYLDSFIHEWLTEQQRRNQKDDIHKHLFSDFYLRNNLDYLLQASADTTSVTLLWALLYLITNPDIQNKVYEDIDEIIGKERFPVLEDMKNLNYTRAFIMEVHRRATIVPLSLFHSNKTDDEIRGYHIPKDSVIINNTWSVHYDPKYFPDPYRFNPERFLDEQGKVKPCEYLSPFSIGRRMCPGKSVAEIQIFLYLTSIVQAYELKAPPESNITDKNFSFDKGIVRRPGSFEVLFVSRYN